MVEQKATPSLFELGDLDQFEAMRDSCDRIARYIADTSQADFQADMMRFDAVCLNLIRIGEAARHLTDTGRASLPDTKWPDIITLRNRIAHGYATLDARVIWRTASFSVPELAVAVTSVLPLPD